MDFCRHHGAQFYRPAWFNLVLRAKQDVALRPYLNVRLPKLFPMESFRL